MKNKLLSKRTVWSNCEGRWSLKTRRCWCIAEVVNFDSWELLVGMKAILCGFDSLNK